MNDYLAKPVSVGPVDEMFVNGWWRPNRVEAGCSPGEMAGTGLRRALLLAQVDGSVEGVKGDQLAAAVDGPFQAAAVAQPPPADPCRSARPERA